MENRCGITEMSDGDGAEGQTASSSQVDLFMEANRLATFTNWPNPNISPQSLAKAGFFYLNRSDQVQCAWCQGVIAKWESHDNAFEEHKRFFPNCPRVQYGPLIEFANGGFRDLGIQKLSPPKNGKYSSLDARLRTFATWPISHVQQPEALAQAGLYYQGVDDYVRCFHCNIGLRSWQKEDDPWFEHARWYPQCQFVHLAKGHNYIQKVQDAVSKTVQTNIQEVNIDDAMSLPIARQALEIGIDGGTVRNTIQRRLQATGCPYDNLDDLLKAVFEDVDVPNVELCGTSTGTTTSTSAEMPNERTFSSGETIVPNLLAASDEEHIELNNRKSADPEAKKKEVPVVKSLLEERTADQHLSLEEENRKLKDARLCKICLDEEVGVVFLPCGHLVTCMQCAPGVLHCPMCRSEIKGFVRTFLS